MWPTLTVPHSQCHTDSTYFRTCFYKVPSLVGSHRHRLPTRAAAPLPAQVLVEKLGVADAAAAQAVAAARADPEANPEPACDFYASRLKLLSLLEFDRDRKSMSVLARSGNGGNVLLVKGAAECVLERSTKWVGGHVGHVGPAACLCVASASPRLRLLAAHVGPYME